MTAYTDVFSGANIYPADVSYSALSLTADVSLAWPLEAPEGATLATKIMDISSTGAYSITLPDATTASTGETILFNNLSASTITIKNYGGAQVTTVASGTQWQVYLANNTTQNGVWRAYQFGAATTTANASALAGNGLVASGATLRQAADTVGFTLSFTLGADDTAKFFNWEGSGAGVTVTLPSAISVGTDWFIQLRNSGDASITVATSGGQLINGASSLVFNPGDSAFIASNATGFFTVGFGQNAIFAFDYTSIDISGSTDYTLSGNELNRISYRLTGTLTADITVIVPSTVQQYWVINEATGGDVYIGTATQISPVLLPTSTNNIYYCDGSNVVVAVTAQATVTFVSGGAF